jgi:hypothetical protein
MMAPQASITQVSKSEIVIASMITHDRTLPVSLSLAICLIVLCMCRQTSAQPQETDGDPPALIALGTNKNPQISESSGLASSAYFDDAVWTINDSGNPPKLFLIRHTGKLIAEVDVDQSANRDWEALTRFTSKEQSYLLIADVGDNSRKAKGYSFYLVKEPDFSKANPKAVVRKSLEATRIQFSYPDGPKNCEAVAVDAAAKNVWLVEKVYYTSKQKTPPGIYVLPLQLSKTDQPLTARRVANFPIRNVTGMSFSSDGKRLLIRNYVNAHLYSREPNETWEQVLNRFKPTTVVMPLQRIGEAVCFTKDSKSVILTSELTGQPIWQVNLKRYLGEARVQKKTKTQSENK